MSDIKLFYPTNFEIVELNMLVASSDQRVDLLPYFVELNFFEDIFSPTISAQIVLSDAVSLATNFRMNGTEFITISFRKFRDDPNIIRRTLRLYKISNKRMDNSLNYDSYVLNLCSEEFLIAEQYRISKSFKGTVISDIVTSVLQDYLLVGQGNTKQINIEPTNGVYDFILPNKKIFETINWLTTYALPKDGVGADMLFFENSNGYYFASLQSLFKQDSYIKYYYNPKNISNDVEAKIKNVLSMEVIDFFDTLGGISKGTFSNRLIVIDPIMRTNTVVDFDYGGYLAQGAKQLNDFPILPLYKDRHGKYIQESPDSTKIGLDSGTLRMVVGNIDQKKMVSLPDEVANDIFVDKFLPNRVAQLALANYIKIRIQVPGNNELVAGMAIDFTTPTTLQSGGVNTASKEEDPFLSGKYIITAVRHMMKSVGPTSYITILELAKDSIGQPIPAVPDSSEWTDAINGVETNVQPQ